ncbi:MAG: hypothetical protein AAF703_17980 [Cyanobacteria bacterium P01_D01_bin.105]
MSQQSPKLVSNTHYCLVGDVSVDATAAIAPGVVLQAGSGSRIIIGKNACLAAGVCVQSRKGVLTIAAGVSLGANVLVVGSGEIGADACISAGATLIDPSVEAGGIVPPGSLVDGSTASIQRNRSQVNGSQSSNAQGNGFQSNGFQPSGFKPNSYQNNGYQNGVSQSYSTFQTHNSSTNDDVQSTYTQGQNPAYGYQNGHYQSERDQTVDNQSSNSFNGNSYNSSYSSDSNANNGNASDSSQITVRSSYDRVYGREQVSKLISALFPNRKPPNG